MAVIHYPECSRETPPRLTHTSVRHADRRTVRNATATLVVMVACDECGGIDPDTVEPRGGMQTKHFYDPETGTPFSVFCLASTTPTQALVILDNAADDMNAPEALRALSRRRRARKERRNPTVPPGAVMTAWGPVWPPGAEAPPPSTVGALGIDWGAQ